MRTGFHVGPLGFRLFCTPALCLFEKQRPVLPSQSDHHGCTRPYLLYRCGVLHSHLSLSPTSFCAAGPLPHAVPCAQVAEFTFVHLHSLSLEWHLKKKMGQVLRAMDRGIAAADNVVQYLCLSLFPTLVECVFTLVIFWAHFKLPILAAVAMLSFAMYCWLTITITLWRKKFREQVSASWAGECVLHCQNKPQSALCVRSVLCCAHPVFALCCTVCCVGELRKWGPGLLAGRAWGDLLYFSFLPGHPPPIHAPL